MRWVCLLVLIFGNIELLRAVEVGLHIAQAHLDSVCANRIRRVITPLCLCQQATRIKTEPGFVPLYPTNSFASGCTVTSEPNHVCVLSVKARGSGGKDKQFITTEKGFADGCIYHDGFTVVSSLQNSHTHIANGDYS